MALTQPILYSQSAFDATQEHTFSFNVIGGDQVVANTLIIKNNETDVVVYSQKQVTFALNHILPSNTLTNGVYYNAVLTTENSNEETSVNSNTIQFYCYSTPSFTFSNLINGANLTTSSYNFEVSYSQTESEPLEQYTFNLYDYSLNLIATSGVLYTNNNTGSFSTQYSFTGFSNNTSYYIECIGITKEGTQITTNRFLFGVNYNSSSTKLNLINNCLGGYIFISSNPVAIFGTSNPDPPIYITDNDDTLVDLRNQNSYVLWDNGFTTSTTDWTLSIWGKDFVENKNICTLENLNKDKITVDFVLENNKVYCILTAKNFNNNNNYKIYSNKIDSPNSTDDIMVWIRRIDNIYDLFIYNITI